MTEPRVPGTDEGGDDDDGGGGSRADDDWVDLPCGERAHLQDFDMGMRNYACSCGDTHAVVMDMHPPSRWVPESIVEVLVEAVEPAEDDEFEEFGTPHLMGAVLEELPEEVTAVDASENGGVGYAMCWVTDLDARELHRVVVELVVELMDHAVSHADAESSKTEFQQQLEEFDVEEFVAVYRQQRDFEDEYDTAV